ncbi:hypothetical protein Trydic_g21581 [Trypoxylus dichotomus]
MPKDKIKLEDQGTCEIPCKMCVITYTEQPIDDQVYGDHITSLAKQQRTSSLFQHQRATDYEINFNNKKILARTDYLSRRIVREAIDIEKRFDNMNKRDDVT